MIISKVIRLLKTESQIPVKQSASGTIIYSPEYKELLFNQKEYLSSTGAISLEFYEAIPNIDEYKNYPSLSVPSTGSQVFLKTNLNILGTGKKEKIISELKDINLQTERLEKLLASDFSNKAPVQVVQKEKEKLEAYKLAAKKLQDQLK